MQGNPLPMATDTEQLRQLNVAFGAAETRGDLEWLGQGVADAQLPFRRTDGKIVDGRAQD